MCSPMRSPANSPMRSPARSPARAHASKKPRGDGACASRHRCATRVHCTAHAHRGGALHPGRSRRGSRGAPTAPHKCNGVSRSAIRPDCRVAGSIALSSLANAVRLSSLAECDRRTPGYMYSQRPSSRACVESARFAMGTCRVMLAHGLRGAPTVCSETGEQRSARSNSQTAAVHRACDARQQLACIARTRHVPTRREHAGWGAEFVASSHARAPRVRQATGVDCVCATPRVRIACASRRLYDCVACASRRERGSLHV